MPKRLTESLGDDTKVVWGIGITRVAEGLSEQTFGHGAASSAIFRIDPVKGRVIVQTRDVAGAKYEEFSKQFFKRIGELTVNRSLCLARYDGVPQSADLGVGGLDEVARLQRRDALGRAGDEGNSRAQA